MRITSAAIILALSLAASTAAAAAAPDRCAGQDKALRIKALEACSGLSYLFNPSGCFIARKARKAFDIDGCRAAAAPEETVIEPPPQTTTAALPPPRCDMPERAPHGAALPEPDQAQLKAENARLKAEIVRLRAEVEQLKGEGYTCIHTMFCVTCDAKIQ
jgi:hypothetical protein